MPHDDFAVEPIKGLPEMPPEHIPRATRGWDFLGQPKKNLTRLRLVT